MFSRSVDAGAESALEPGSYWLVSNEPYAYDGVTFTVAAVEVPALAAPGLLDADRQTQRDRTWGDSKGIVVSFTEVGDAVQYEVAVATTADFSDEALALVGTSSAFLGDGLCGLNIERSIDGSVSAWSEPVPVAPGLFGRVLSGCSVSPGGAASLVFALTVGLLGFRGRRRGLSVLPEAHSEALSDCPSGGSNSAHRAACRLRPVFVERDGACLLEQRGSERAGDANGVAPLQIC